MHNIDVIQSNIPNKAHTPLKSVSIIKQNGLEEQEEKKKEKNVRISRSWMILSCRTVFFCLNLKGCYTMFRCVYGENMAFFHSPCCWVVVLKVKLCAADFYRGAVVI